MRRKLMQATRQTATPSLLGLAGLRLMFICCAPLVLVGCDNSGTLSPNGYLVNDKEIAKPLTFDELSICSQSNKNSKTLGIACDDYCVKNRNSYPKRLEIRLLELADQIEKIPKDDQDLLDNFERMKKDKYGNIDYDNSERIFKIQYRNPYYTSWKMHKDIRETLDRVNEIHQLSKRNIEFRDLIIQRIDLSTSFFLKFHFIGDDIDAYVSMDRNRTPAIIDKLDSETASSMIRWSAAEQAILAGYISCNTGLLR